MTTFTPEMASAATRGDLACVAHAAVARHPARGDGRRARVRALHRSGAPDHRRAAATRCVLGRRRVGGRPTRSWPSRWVCCRSRSICSRCARFYARHDTYTPFWINCIENVVNIALAFPLYAWLGIPGLALAFALAYFVGAIVTLGVLRVRLDGIDGAQITSSLTRIVAAGVVVGGVSWAVGEFVGWSSFGHAGRRGRRRDRDRRRGVRRAAGAAAGRRAVGGAQLWYPPGCGRAREACNDHDDGRRQAPPSTPKAGATPVSIRVVTDSACDLPAGAGRRAAASRSSRSPSASATRSSSTARS